MASFNSSSYAARSIDQGPPLYPFEGERSAGITSQKIIISEAHFSNPEEAELWNRVARLREKVVCQIQTSNRDKKGSGFLIGGNLLMTNHHLLSEPKDAQDGCARFFKVVSQDPLKTDTLVRTIQIALRPDVFFYTSPKEDRRSGTKPVDDFTVVALDVHPYLAEVQDSVFSLFGEEVVLKEGSGVCILHHPDRMDSSTMIEGDLKRSFGVVKKLGDATVDYDAPTHTGSSGGAAINIEGKLVALHVESTRELKPGKTQVLFNSGLRIGRIVAALADQRTAIERWLKTELPVINSPPITIINLPLPANHFTGREEELAILHQACLEERKWIAVVGMGGVGKTALAIKYANDHQSDYSLISFIQSGTTSQINTGLLDLANALNVPGGSLEERLKFLKTHLETYQGRALLIFDGIDDDKTLAYLEAQLPLRGCTTLLVSSRLENSTAGEYFFQLSLEPFKLADAVSFLLQAVDGKDTDAEQATALVQELFLFPLALEHAAAYIKQTRGSTFKRYRESLKKYGLRLFDSKYNYSKNEQTILTTWQKSIEAIKEIHQCPLAERMLQFASVFGDAPIPLELLRNQFSDDELDFDLGITQLGNYSLIKTSEESVVIHSLLRKVILYQLKQELKEEFLQDAVKLLYDCHKELDISRPVEDWEPHSLVPHLDAVLKEAQGIVSTDSPEIEFLSKICSAKKAFFGLMVFELLHNSDRYEKALTYALYAESVLSETLGGNHLTTAQSYISVGASLSGLCTHKEALSYQQRALEIRLEKLGQDDLRTAESHHHLWAAFNNLGRHEEALIHQKQALRIHREKLGEDDPKTAESRHHLAISFSYLDKRDKALIHQKQALEIRSKKLGENDSETAESHYHLGATLIHLGQFQEGFIHAQRALEVRIQKFGHEDLTTADSYNGVGIALHKLGKHEEALVYKQRALEIRRQKLGEDDPKTIDSYDSVEATLVQLGRYEEVRIHQQDVLEVRKKKFGEDDLMTAGSYDEVANTLIHLGKYKEALIHARSALRIRGKKLDPDHPEIAESHYRIGVAFSNLRKHQKAFTHEKRALEIRRQKLGESNLTTAESYYGVGNTLAHLGRFEEGVHNAQRALEIRRFKLGDDDLKIADSHHSVGAILHELGVHDQAFTHVQRALNIRRVRLGEKHSDTANSHCTLEVIRASLGKTADDSHFIGEFYLGLTRYSEAFTHLLKALAIRRKILGEKSLEMADSYHAIGKVMLGLKNIQQASSNLKKALEIRKELLGEMHPQTIEISEILNRLSDDS